MMDAAAVAGLGGGSVTISGLALDSLAAMVGGPLLRPADDGFDEAVRLWNAMVAKTPALVAQPLEARGVAGVVAFARDQGLLLSVKGGGHNIAGTSIADGGLVIDLSRMRDVQVDASARRVRVGPGCLLKDVDQATQEHGLAAVLGFVSSTGVAGLTLGGGFGFLTRRFGWAVDLLEEVEIVTADGTVRRANRKSHDDLFWALRGGGGNFGVVTEFVFSLRDVGPLITGGLILWGAERAEDVVGRYREVTETGPRELTLAVTMRRAPAAPFVPERWHGKPVVGIVACHSGEVGQAETDLAPIRDLGEPIVDLIGIKPYAEQQSMLDATQPKGLHYYWKSEFLPGLSSGLLADFRREAARIVSPLSQLIMFHLEGALGEHPPDDGAVGNRDAAYVCAAAGAWRPDDHDGEGHRQWVRSAWEAIRPHSTGGNYMNFQTSDEDESRTRAAYGQNFERLAAVKAAYDPGNLFRANRNIAPA